MKQVKHISSRTGIGIVGLFTLLITITAASLNYWMEPINFIHKVFYRDRIVLMSVASVGDELVLQADLPLMPSVTPSPTPKPKRVVVAAKEVTQSPDKAKAEHLTNPAIAPTPTHGPGLTQPLPPSSYDEMFQHHGQTYGVSPEVLKKIAKCESGFNPAATNGPYGGMFQFHSGTWQSNRRAMGADDNPALRFSAEEAVKTAAYKISRDGTGAWPVCGR